MQHRSTRKVLSPVLGSLAACTLLIACGSSASDEPSGSSPPTGGTQSGGETTVADDEQPYPTYERALEMTADCQTHYLAAIEVTSIAISASGSRSQAMNLSARVLASSAPGAASGTLTLEQYVGGTVFMQQGGRYVAVMCINEGETSLLGWRRLTGDPQAAVQ